MYYILIEKMFFLKLEHIWKDNKGTEMYLGRGDLGEEGLEIVDLVKKGKKIFMKAMILQLVGIW